jgi:hypothetical protein
LRDRLGRGLVSLRLDVRVVAGHGRVRVAERLAPDLRVNRGVPGQRCACVTATLMQDALAGERKIRSYDQMVAEDQPRVIIPGLLTAGLYGLAEPPEAGKSLWCRDLACGVAADGGGVLYAISEGQFDLLYRFGAHPRIDEARPRLGFLDAALSLASAADVDWLTERASGVSLIIFDMIYGFGLPDDEGAKGVAPVLAGCKRLAAKLGCAVLITGHPGHLTGRPFRGSSMWRGSFDGEFHMADNRMSCEKHKYADKRRSAGSTRWLTRTCGR